MCSSLNRLPQVAEVTVPSVRGSIVGSENALRQTASEEVMADFGVEIA